MADRPIRLIIADPDGSMRRILATLLAEEDEVIVVGEASDEKETLEAAAQLGPELVLLGDALASPKSIADLRSARSAPNVIVLATYRQGAKQAFAAGATDYVLKDAGRDQLMEVIRRAGLRGPQ